MYCGNHIYSYHIQNIIIYNIRKDTIQIKLKLEKLSQIKRIK
jgi:hypothetical protein